MKSFTEPLLGLKEYEELKQELIKTKGVVQVSGCIDAQKPHFMCQRARGACGGFTGDSLYHSRVRYDAGSG